MDRPKILESGVRCRDRPKILAFGVRGQRVLYRIFSKKAKRLLLNKSQLSQGSGVKITGKKVNEHLPPSTLKQFDVSRRFKPDGALLQVTTTEEESI